MSVNYDALLDYTSYAAAFTVPITFPLLIGLCVQAALYVDIARLRFFGKPTGVLPPDGHVEGAVVAIVIPETVFGILCVSQCIVNRVQRIFVGLDTACDFQAFYSTYYVFASLALQVYGVVLGVTMRGQSDVRSITIGSATCRASCLALQVAGGALASHGLALLIAALPLTGVPAYLFAIDFCTFEVEGPLFGTLFALAYVGGLAAMVAALAWERKRGTPPRRTPLLLPVAVGWFALSYFTVLLISLTALGQRPVYSSAGWEYAVMAVFVHSNQIVVPIIYAFWRRDMHDVVSPAASQNGNAAGGRNETLPLEPQLSLIHI